MKIEGTNESIISSEGSSQRYKFLKKQVDWELCVIYVLEYWCLGTAALKDSG
jgi:hypothetical protein